jgi:hypothetical protein
MPIFTSSTNLTSLPAPPRSTSVPTPPVITSSPAEPVMVSLPVPPSIEVMWSGTTPLKSRVSSVRSPAIVTPAGELRTPRQCRQTRRDGGHRPDPHRQQARQRHHWRLERQYADRWWRQRHARWRRQRHTAITTLA